MSNLLMREELWFNLSVFHYIITKIIIPGSLIVLTSYFFSYVHPINPLLAFIGICVLMLIYLFNLNVHFLALIFGIIYIGAILILFLFVIMLFRKVYSFYYKSFVSIEWLLFLSFTVFWINKIMQDFVIWTQVTVNEKKLFSVAIDNNQSSPMNSIFEKSMGLEGYVVEAINSNNIPSTLVASNIEVFIDDLYVHYSLFFLISGCILLIAMVGAITIIFLVKKE